MLEAATKAKEPIQAPTDTHFDSLKIVKSWSDVQVECQLRRKASWDSGGGTAPASVEIDDVPDALSVSVDCPVMPIEWRLIAVGETHFRRRISEKKGERLTLARPSTTPVAFGRLVCL